MAGTPRVVSFEENSAGGTGFPKWKKLCFATLFVYFCVFLVVYMVFNCFYLVFTGFYMVLMFFYDVWKQEKCSL